MGKKESRRGRVCFELLEVALLDLLHEGFAFEKVVLNIGRNIARNDEELIVNHFREGDGAARGDQMGAPLKN
jgi:hypothetical protein